MAQMTAAQKKADAKKQAEQKAQQPDPNTAVTASVPNQSDGADQDNNTAQPSQPPLLSLAMAFSMGENLTEKQTQIGTDLWNDLGCENMPPKLALAIFDCAHDQSAKVCERLLGKVGITRKNGQFDISALNADNQEDILRDFLAWRLRRYAFTAAAATKMLEWSQRILMLHALPTEFDLEAD